MRLLFILIGLALFLIATTGCMATTPVSAAAPQYPAWLEMKEGYAEACAAAGKCTPFTDQELSQLANTVFQRTMQMCERGRT